MGETKATLVRRAIEVEGFAPSAAAMVGDRRDDVVGAKENGLLSIGVEWGFGTAEELAEADRLISSPPLLPTCLLGL